VMVLAGPLLIVLFWAIAYVLSKKSDRPKW
jgi:hypothetical protein